MNNDSTNELYYKDLYINNYKALIDRILCSIPNTTLKSTLTDLYDVYINKVDKEIQKIQFENILLVKEKEMRFNASKNSNFSDLRRQVDEKRM